MKIILTEKLIIEHRIGDMFMDIVSCRRNRLEKRQRAFFEKKELDMLLELHA